MKIRISAAQRRKLNKQIADTAAAQRRAVGVLADELARRKVADLEPVDLSDLFAEPLNLEWDDDVLAALAEPVDLSELTSLKAMDALSQSFAEMDAEYHQPRPVFIPIDDDPSPAKLPRPRQRRQRSR